MAIRARLVAPPPKPKQTWPWHTLKHASVSVRQLLSEDRRMEGETYLSSGFAIRSAIESNPNGWTRLIKLAKVWMPGRLKGIQVSSDFGTPFLASTQAFDVRPIPRKWLALSRTSDAKNRFVQQGMILVTCSGSVGRATLAHAPHLNTLISHDLLRVETIVPRNYGWLYAYLRTPQVRAMATGMHYGHIIKHLETSHLEALPVPVVDKATADDFLRRVAKILELRNESYRLTLEAEDRFEKALTPLKVTDWGNNGFTVKASTAFLGGRRRFDASIHNPGVGAIRRHLAKHGEGFTTIAEAGYEVWLPTRFRRIPAEEGVRLVSSSDLTEVNPDLNKHIVDGDFGDVHKGRVEAGWVLMARSGQSYGIIGTAILAGIDLEGCVISDHVMRIKPGHDAEIKPGYLVTALSHPMLGRPLIKSLAYGSSIPEIEVADFAGQEVVRLKPAVESAIANLAEASAQARAAADLLEREIAWDASAIIERFTSRPRNSTI